jgi:hypothetical protein
VIINPLTNIPGFESLAITFAYCITAELQHAGREDALVIGVFLLGERR